MPACGRLRVGAGAPEVLSGAERRDVTPLSRRRRFAVAGTRRPEGSVASQPRERPTDEHRREDSDVRHVRVQGLAGGFALDRATQDFGLAVPSGIVTHTGVAGLTLGWLGVGHAKHGLTIDQLSSVELITAEGELVTASETENADLFWGVRGGGNFGMVTQFEFRLCAVGPAVVAGPTFWPMKQSPAVLRFYREWIADAPDELMTIVIHREAPPLTFVPPRSHRHEPAAPRLHRPERHSVNAPT